MSLKAIIIDDDELSRRTLEKCIERSGSIEVAGEFDSALDALDVIHEIPCDIIFLDIEMPEMNGLEFMKEFSADRQVVIMSSKAQYAAEAFDFDVTDYLVKPIQYTRFLKAIQKIKKNGKNTNAISTVSDHLFLKKNNKFVRVEIKDILFIEAVSDYVKVVTETDHFVVLSTMKALESKLPVDEFMRIHRSYIIRLDKIKDIEENMVKMGSNIVPVSRGFKSVLFDRLNLL